MSESRRKKYGLKFQEKIVNEQPNRIAYEEFKSSFKSVEGRKIF